MVKRIGDEYVESIIKYADHHYSRALKKTTYTPKISNPDKKRKLSKKQKKAYEIQKKRFKHGFYDALYDGELEISKTEHIDVVVSSSESEQIIDSSDDDVLEKEPE